MRRVYLDHAATTPVRPEVAQIMLKYMVEDYGNPSSVHAFGRTTRAVIDDSREKLAKLIGADAEEIVFTSGGTEADNLALKGSLEAYPDRGRHIITSQIEHHAILHTCEYLEKHGYDVTYVGVDSDGKVSVDEVARAMRDDTALVSIMLANNEVGTLQPIEEIAKITKAKGVLLHTDSVQAAGQIPIDVKKMGVDMMSISAHKMYGPKGIGALYVRRGVRVAPVIHGGGHERGKRAGTENVPGIAAFGKAAELAIAEFDQRVEHYLSIRERLIDGILSSVPHSRLNGHRHNRLPNNANIGIRFVEGESMLLNLDMHGIAMSSGSACTSGSLEPSHVLRAMGISHEDAHGSLRMTCGMQTTAEDVDYVLSVLPGIVKRLRDMSPLGLEDRQKETK